MPDDTASAWSRSPSTSDARVVPLGLAALVRGRRSRIRRRAAVAALGRARRADLLDLLLALPLHLVDLLNEAPASLLSGVRGGDERDRHANDCAEHKAQAQPHDPRRVVMATDVRNP